MSSLNTIDWVPTTVKHYSDNLKLGMIFFPYTSMKKKYNKLTNKFAKLTNNIWWSIKRMSLKNEKIIKFLWSSLRQFGVSQFLSCWSFPQNPWLWESMLSPYPKIKLCSPSSYPKYKLSTVLPKRGKLYMWHLS